MRKHIFNYTKQKIIEELRLTKAPQNTFDKVVVDLVGPLPKSINDNVYILTLMCDLSKYLICVPIPNKNSKSDSRQSHFAIRKC